MEKEYKEIIKQNLHNTLATGYIPELGKHKSGKVRDIHFTKLQEGEPIVMVASDRVSSFDFILNRCIPFKGQVLNRFNQWAMEQTKDIVPNANLPSPHPNVLIQKYCKNVMVECVVRGYVWGSMAGEYEKGKRGEIYGLQLPEGLLRYQKLDEPLFTPTTKADEHDVPMTFSDVEKQLGKEVAAQVKELSIKLYKRGEERAKKRGLIFIDTKYEFGLDKNGMVTLIDEANTPDSSRYCTVEEYEKFEKIKQEMGSYENVSALLKERPELKIKEMSKQFVRDVLTKKGFSYGSKGEPPALNDEDVIEVSYRYIALYEQLTGEEFPFPQGNVHHGLLDGLQRAGLIKGGLVIIMAGSDSDLPHMESIKKELDAYDIPVEFRICSAHKQPGTCEKIIATYNQSIEPLVFVTVAGGTDALSGVVSLHSIFPVISCPPKEEHESCLQNPPGSSNSTILRPANVARHAAKILGRFKPELYEKIKEKNAEKIEKLEQADEKERGIRK